MTIQKESKSIELRVPAIEIRMGAVEALMNNFITDSLKPSKTVSKEEKDRIKAELLKGVPYNNKGLENLKLTELRLLASAMGINSFGMKRAAVIKAVISKQKK